MRLALMQPYFFPYLGYFDLINCADRWLVFDTCQYIVGGWINRNRVLHDRQGWKYITVPLRKHASDTAIKDVHIAKEIDWQGRIIGHLQHYKKAPHFGQTMDLVARCLRHQQSTIARLNVLILERICSRLGIDFSYAFLSEMNLELGPIEGPADWGMRACEALGASEFVNPPGGAHFHDGQRFADHGIKLSIRRLAPLEYDCGEYEFIPDLSIIDVLMFNEPDTIKAYLDRHRLGAEDTDWESRPVWRET